MSGEGFVRNDFGDMPLVDVGDAPRPRVEWGEGSAYAPARSPGVEGDSVDAVVRERIGVLAYRHTAEAQVDQLIASGRLRADDATVLKARLRAFAEGVAQGLHVGGEDPPAVRHAMRAAIIAGTGIAGAAVAPDQVDTPQAGASE